MGGVSDDSQSTIVIHGDQAIKSIAEDQLNRVGFARKIAEGIEII